MDLVNALLPEPPHLCTGDNSIDGICFPETCSSQLTAFSERASNLADVCHVYPNEENNILKLFAELALSDANKSKSKFCQVQTPAVPDVDENQHSSDSVLGQNNSHPADLGAPTGSNENQDISIIWMEERKLPKK
ncbi:hypothetical protein HDV06_003806, partial [Boothiomyces sp. JEL0866]